MTISAPAVDNAAPIEVSRSPSAIAEPWRRLVAYELDALLLSIAASRAAEPFFDRLSRLGWWAWLVGYCVTLAYFAIFDSKVGNGQTIGKRLLKLRVVDARGDCVSIAKAAARCTIFAIPCLLFGLHLSMTRTPWIVSVLLGSVTYGVGGATLYLVTFNRWTRQGLHDLATGTYVVSAQDGSPVEALPVPYIHWLIIGTSLVAVGAGATAVHFEWPDYGTSPELREDSRLIEQIDGVLRCPVTDLISHAGGGAGQKILFVPVVMAKEPASEEIYADGVARTILLHDQYARSYDVLRVRIYRGYDIGIARDQKTWNFEYSPAQWAQRVLGTSSAQSGL
jgi:uncharacterized RDD family membrane protein YckC